MRLLHLGIAATFDSISGQIGQISAPFSVVAAARVSSVMWTPLFVLRYASGEGKVSHGHCIRPRLHHILTLINLWFK